MCKTPEDLNLNGVDTVAVDIETYDPNLKSKGLGAIRGDGFICGIAIATINDTTYFPLRHADTDLSLDKQLKVWEVLNEKIFQNDKITKVFHNAMYDVCWIRAVTGKMIKGRIVDTMIAASIIDENRFRYTLDSLSKDYLQDEKYKYDLQEKTLKWSGGTVKDPMTNMHKLPASIVKEYAKQDVSLTLRLWNLFNYKTTPKSEMPQLPKDFLKTHKNRYLRFVAKAREYDKAKNTFVDGLLDFVHNERIHADINQIRSEKGGTVTGRFSMSNPNLQQIPSKGFIGKKMRELFIPEVGCEWGSFDYSQQEPRIVVHYALKINLPGTDNLKEEFDKDDADFHQIVADMAKIPRKQAKVINLGLFYGMGKIKLQKELNLDEKKATKLFQNYHAQVPFVRDLSQRLSKFAGQNGLLFTLGDRFCRFDKWETRDKEWDPKINRFTEVELYATKEKAMDAYKLDQMEKYGKYIDPDCEHFEKHYARAFTYKALNRLIQGSAADMTKKAMVDLYEKGIVPHIQIHDELCVSIRNKEERNTVHGAMENTIALNIKNKVDYESGPNWGTIK